MPPKDSKHELDEVKWSLPGPCPVTPEQFDAIYDDDEGEEANIDPSMTLSLAAIGAAAAKMIETFKTMWLLIARAAKLYESYPNGRVKRLALYAKKERTRKKNMRRIARELKRRMERDRPRATEN